MRRLFVDADACPKVIREEILIISRSYELIALFVASFQHATNEKGAEWVLVDADPENVDLYIMNHVRKGDIAVTQDYGLASVLVSKGVYVLSTRGKKLVEEDMPQLLYGRYISAKERQAGNRTKGPKKFNNEDRETFSKELINILSNF
jgi:uncharacterized protein YaiI (UPF0178 family)